MDIFSLMTVVLISNGITDVQAAKEIQKDYCAFESFSPECSSDEIVIMTSATYGRMSLGKCLKKDYGNLDCQADVMSYFDKQCSGRRGCQINVHNEYLTAKVSSCLEELSAYLNAGFHCQKVYLPRNGLCDNVHRIIAPQRKENYLASLTTKETLCGLHDTPFMISARPGQRLKLSLIDFSWQDDVTTPSPSTCHVDYGYIVDMATNDFTTICGGGHKLQELYTTIGNSVQIVLDSMSIQSHNFIIKYEVLGCPDINVPATAWISRANDTLTIGCHNSDARWRLTCMNSIWLGYLGNCSGSDSGGVKVQEQTENEDQSSATVFNKNHVLAFTLGCVTLIVCITTVIVGFYCIKRYEAKRTTDSTTLHYDDATILSSRCMAGFHPVHSSTLQTRAPNSHHDIPSCTLPMLHKHPPLIPQRINSYNSNTVARCQALRYPTTPTEASNFHFFSPASHIQDGATNKPHTGSQQIPLSQSNQPHLFPPTSAGSNCLLDVFDDVDVNDNSKKDAPVATFDAPRHYFVLEQPRESVSSETDQLYQSIHYKSTDHITQ